MLSSTPFSFFLSRSLEPWLVSRTSFKSVRRAADDSRFVWIYLGKRVACQHCGAQFAACDPQSPESVTLDSSVTLLSRVDQLLEASARRDTVATSGR